MIQQSRILILTSETGGGHISLAEALREQLQPDFIIRTEDLLPRFIPHPYRSITQKAPWLWSSLYHGSNIPALARLGHLGILPLIKPRLLSLLESFQPDLVLSVHPLLTRAVKRVLEQHAPQVPIATLFCDPMNTHATWYTERGVAASLVPTSEMYAQALAHGFDPARLHDVGWPVRRQFTSLLGVPREQVIADLNRRQQWDLDPACLTIFAASGAEGATHIERAARLALDVSQDVQVILASGVNWSLYHRCQGIRRLYAFPFTGQIAPFMAAAHLVMGRCSPNILFESLTLGKPFIATSSLPGQEEGNLRFIAQHALGWVALESTQLRSLIGSLASDVSSDSSMLNAMRATVEAYQRKNMLANVSLVPHIRALIDHGDQSEKASSAFSTKAAWLSSGKGGIRHGDAKTTQHALF